MGNLKRKMMAIILTAALGAGLAVAPVHAEAGGMTVSAPKYYRVVAESAVDGYDAFDEVEAPVDGVFTDIVTYATESNFDTITGKFKTEVDVANGSGSSVTLLGAVYDDDNKLVGISSDSKAAADASDTLSVTTEVGQDETFKALIWDSTSGLTPIETQDKAPTIRYFYCDDPNTVTIAWNDEGGSYSLYKNNVAVDISGLSTVTAADFSNMGKYPIFVYTDTSAAAGDTYVVKNGTVSSDALVASFADGASVTLGKYVTGRNMAYIRNDNIQWWHNSVSQHQILAGRDCDVRVYRSYYQNDDKKEKWTNFYFKFDQDFLSGSGNTVDVTVNYFDKGTEPLWLYYYPDSDPTATTRVAIVPNMADSKTWKTVTYRLSGVTFAADTNLDYECQMFMTSATGSAISSVSVVPYIDNSIATLRAANTYTDGIELRWTTVSTVGVTGYTIKRNGTTIATNYQHRTYYDENLADDTQYTYTVTAETANGLGTESDPLVTRTSKNQSVSMTLPLSGASKTTYTENGLSFWINTDDRFDFGFSKVVTRGEVDCRSTVCLNRSDPRKGDLWYDYYTYTSGADRRSSYMSFTVDNSIIDADQRTVVIEFDYYDDSNSELSGKGVEIKYLKYNDGGTPTTGTATAATIAGTNTWKTAKVTLTDAQFNHASGVLESGKTYDFRIGMGINRGGFASTNIKVYVPGASSMPEHTVYAEVNAEGTAVVGTLPASIWDGSYDRNIGYSGTDGMSAVGGKHYLYNREYEPPTNQGWKRWRNGFYFKVPDDFLYGSDYTKVEIEVEYYAPTATAIAIVAKNSSGDTTIGRQSATTGAWITQTFTINSGVLFSNGFDSSADFRFTFEDAQGYVHKVTVKKDYLIED